MITVWFLHEAAHGFGYWLEGTHVSTGFNLVGASGKIPTDPDFRVELPIEGLTIGLLLGPLSSWASAMVFTAILLRREVVKQSSLAFGAVAVAGAMMRLIPLAIFFVAAVLGSTNGAWQDEHLMSLSAIESLKLPVSESKLTELIDSEPATFLEDVNFYVWPLVSLAISLVCFVLAYRNLFWHFGPQLQSRWRKIAFGVLPLLLYFPVFGVVSILDNIVRIDW
jgi:hypothetical protein